MSDTQAPPGPGGESADAGLIRPTGVIESLDVSVREDVHKLRKGAVGLSGVLFLTLTGSAPISAMLFNTPISVGFGNGIGTPAGFLVATIVLRSLTGAALVILPLLVTVLIEFGLMAGFGVSLNPSTATISAMSVGIGADYAIYLLYRFREEYQQRRFVEPALAETLRTSGRAVLFVALAIGGGYGTLALSGFEPFRVTGIFVMLTMTVSCLSALLLMMSCMVALRPRFVFAGSGAV